MQLQDLKKELEKYRTEAAQLHALLQERERQVEEIHQLKGSLENQILEIHRINNPQKKKELQQEIDEKGAKIDHLKKNVSQLDHEIDLLPDETQISRLKQNILKQIQKDNPQAAQLLEKSEIELDEAKKEQNILEHQKKLIDPLTKLLTAGLSINIKNGFLNTILGRNPKARLARIIRQAAEIAENLYPHIEDPQLKGFLSDFISEANAPVNPNLYRDRFPQLCQQLHQILEKQDSTLQHLVKKITHEEQNIDNWFKSL